MSRCLDQGREVSSAPDGHWRDVPDEALTAWNEAFATARGATLPTPCPICGARSLHQWYHTHRVERLVFDGRPYRGRGGVWQWCSRCRHYVHASGLVPEWWASDVDVPRSALTTVPDALDEALRRESEGRRPSSESSARGSMRK